MKNKSNKLKSFLAIALGSTLCFASMPVVSKHAFTPAFAKESGVVYTPSSKSIANGNFETVGDTLSGWQSSRISSSNDLTHADNKINSTVSGVVNVLDESKYRSSIEAMLRNSTYLNYAPTDYPTYPNRYDSASTESENTTTSALLINAGKIVDTTKKVYTVKKIDASTTSEEVEIPSTNLPTADQNFIFTSQAGSVAPSGTYTFRNDTTLGNVWEQTLDGTTYQIVETGSHYPTTNNAVYETYTSSSDLQLASNCYFKLTFRVYTSGDSSTLASIRLTGDLEKNDNASFESINTSNTWKEYTYYIATNYGSTGMNKTRIQLALGNSSSQLSTGAVFFDDVDLTEIQYKDFYKAQSSLASSETTRIVNMRADNERVITSFDGTKTMEQEGFSWDDSTSATDDAFTVIKEEDKTSYSTFQDNNYCLKVTNSTDNKISFKTSKTTVEPFKYYKVSIWSRYDYEDLDMFKNPTSFTHDKFTISLSGTLNGKTVATKSYDIDPYNENQRKTDGNGHVSNFWTQTSFYVQACPIYSTDVWLNISVPKNSTFLFDNYTIEEITSTEYSAMSDRKLALTSTLPKESVPNGFFNTVDSDKTSAGLYSPSNWTYTTGGFSKETNYYLIKEITDEAGETTTERIILDEKYLTIENEVKIIDESESTNHITYTYDSATKTYKNTSTDGKTNSTIYTIKNDEIINGVVVGKDYSNVVNSKNITTNDASFVNPTNALENFLCINNTNGVIMPQIKYTSEKFSVASGKYTSLIVNIYSELNESSPAKINLLNADSKVIAILDIDTVPCTANQNNWQEYKFCIKGGLTAENMYVQIQYGNGKTTLQGALLAKTIYLSPLSENDFKENQKLTSTEIKAKRLKVVNLAGTSFTELGDKLEADGKFNANGLTLNTLSGENSSYYILDSSLEAYKNYKNANGLSPYVLVLDSQSASTNILEFNQKYSLAKSSFYKLSVTAKAIDLPEGKAGLLKFANLDATLNISGTDYKEYTLYFASGTNALTSYLTLSLENTTGKIALSNVTIEKLASESAYNSGIAKISTETPNITKLDLRSSTTTSDDKLPESKEGNRTLEILFATLSSLLLVVAIIIALVFTRLSGKCKKTHGKKNKVQVSDANDQKGFV